MNFDEMPTPELIRLVATWPTVREVAVEYALPEWWVRTQVERSRVRAMKLTTLRIDPDDWRRFLRDCRPLRPMPALPGQPGPQKPRPKRKTDAPQGCRPTRVRTRPTNFTRED